MIELDKIYNEDCLIGMKQIPDGTIDAVICDLPYEVLNKGNECAQWDRLIPFEPLWEQYLRVCKLNAPIILFCQGMFTAQLLMSQPKLWRYNLVWKKGGMVSGFLNAEKMPLRNHEDIAIFYRKLPTYNPQKVKGVPCHNKGGGNHKFTQQCYGKMHDTPTVIGCMVFVSVMVSIINLLVDILYGLIDPRIKAQYTKGNKNGKRKNRKEER